MRAGKRWPLPREPKLALTLPKLTLPKLSLNRTQILTAVGVLVVVVAGGWFGWDYVFEEPPPSKPAAKAAAAPGPAKQALVAKAAVAKAAAAPAEAQDKLTCGQAGMTFLGSAGERQKSPRNL